MDTKTKMMETDIFVLMKITENERNKKRTIIYMIYTLHIPKQTFQYKLDMMNKHVTYFEGKVFIPFKNQFETIFSC